LLAAAAIAVSAQAEDAWRPAQAPLVTRWAKDVSPANAHPEYPRLQMVRPDWVNLNGLWDYAVTRKDGPAPKEYEGRILVPFPIESALSGVRKGFNGNLRLWYRRLFEAPSLPAGRRLLLHFGAVDWEATVSVNGKELGTHRGGYDGFSFDVTDALKPGGPQELAVSVLDATGGIQPRGKQTGGRIEPIGTLGYTATSGIWQTVWLEPVPRASIAGLKLTPDVVGGKLRLLVTGRDTTDPQTVEAVALAGDKEVCRARGKVGAEIALPIKNARLWTPDTPHLYDLAVTLKEGDRQVDAVRSYFGMREIALGKDEKGAVRMMLNGKFVFQIGPLDQGFWPDGIYTAPTDEALRYDVEMTRRLGFNATRKHIKVEPDRWYYWCDKLGLLVWQDMPSGAGDKSPEGAREFEAELRAMIDGRYNHPCIILWAIFNEGWGQYDTERLAAWVKQHDPSRLVDSASGGKFYPVGDVIDDHPYWIPNAPKPDGRRALAAGEFGGRALVTPGHMTTETNAFGHPGGTVLASPWELTTHYLKLVRKVHEEKEVHGLSAAFCTQLTDLEAECNGFLTYDRAVVKVDLDKVAAANRGVFPPPTKFRILSPTAQAGPVAWRYSFEKPPDDWPKPDFDHTAWKEGPAGFGKGNWRTPWQTEDIWLRHEFTLGPEKLSAPEFLAHHDRNAEIYVNGVLAAKISGYSIEYQEFEMRAEARATLKPGRNVLAVHCHRGDGGQYIDVGLVDPE
jgi:hypothetical protein